MISRLYKTLNQYYRSESSGLEQSREANNMWYFYIARCQDNSLYCGLSNNPNSRISDHNSGKGADWFKKHGDGEIVFTENYAAYIEARKREIQVKKWSRKKKENLIKGFKP